jgi:hypothetical protein
LNFFGTSTVLDAARAGTAMTTRATTASRAVRERRMGVSFESWGRCSS